ncbi:disintegrin and metalloproteinase domain-containing protein 17-like [Physella acuta]|uniref:disintegrin and metalloproteinase domain-containing protein 17-like n=1 Tax=Physella acuta TaxID=109671 RepID=UPI0027DC581D|nr:disintegrin and metalloproteinase domain-containing protein 17-like [Physella acuta]
MIFSCLALVYLTCSHAFGLAMLKYFETLNEIHASSYVKRSDGDQRLIKHLEFTVFQRTFQLTLSSGSSLLSKDFKAHLVDGEGRMKSYTVDQTQVFSGHLTGLSFTLSNFFVDNEDAPVTAYMGDNFWSIHIFDENETYAIEPARNLLTSAENPENDTYIAYRGTDLRNEDEHCAAVNPENFGDDFFTNIPQMPYWKPGYMSPERNPMENTCYLYYAADYYFYSRRCRNHHAICTSLMINSLETVDRIFRQSKFLGPYGNVITDIGFQIGMLVLFVSPSASHHFNKVHFNARDVAWTMDLKLESFSHWTSSLPKLYCHNHLLTSYLMPKQVLGIAYLNGLCDWRGYINSAVTTDESVTGSIPSLMLNLVIAHELGSFI